MNIFITGGTGFLGEELIRRLLEERHSIKMLVRDEDKAIRFVETLPDNLVEQITILAGDIQNPSLGLEDAIVGELKDQVDAFYHLAADVRFNQTLEKMLLTNYHGTQNALQLAASLGCKDFYYVSTAYTVGKRDLAVEDLYPLNGEVNNNYEESKVRTEHLVYSYHQNMNTYILRPAIVIGDSRTGKANSRYTIYAFMFLLSQFRDAVAPKSIRYYVNNTARINLVPVDYVCDVLTAALSHGEPNTIYNIVVDDPLRSIEVVDIIKNAVSFDDLELISEEGGQDLNEAESQLKDMSSIFAPYLNHHIEFENSNTHRLLQMAGKSPIKFSADMLKTIVHAKSEDYVL